MPQIILKWKELFDIECEEFAQNSQKMVRRIFNFFPQNSDNPNNNGL